MGNTGAKSVWAAAEMQQNLENWLSARNLYEKAAELSTETVGEAHPDTATLYSRLGEVLTKLNKPSEAAGTLEKADSLFRECALDSTQVAEHARCVLLLAHLHMLSSSSPPDESVALYQRAIALFEIVEHGGIQGNELYLEKFADCLSELAGVEQRQGDMQTARAHMERAVHVVEKAAGRGSDAHCEKLLLLAKLYKSSAEFEKAREIYRLVGEVSSLSASSSPTLHGQVSKMIFVKRRSEEASCLEVMGRFAEATAIYEEAVKIVTEEKGDPSPQLAAALSNLANCEQNAGHFHLAFRCFERALAVATQLPGGEEAMDTATIMNNLATLLQRRGEYQQALELLQKATAICQRIKGSRSNEYATQLSNLGSCCEAMGSTSKALSLYSQALEICGQSAGTHSNDYAISMNNMAGCLKSQGQYESARDLYIRSLQICAESRGKNSNDYSQILCNLAMTVDAMGDHPRALALLTSAAEIGTRAVGKNHPDVLHVMHCTAHVLREMQRMQEALDICLDVEKSLSSVEGGGERERAAALVASGITLGGLRRMDEGLGKMYDALAILKEAGLTAAAADVQARIELMKKMGGGGAVGGGGGGGESNSKDEGQSKSNNNNDGAPKDKIDLDGKSISTNRTNKNIVAADVKEKKKDSAQEAAAEKEKDKSVKVAPVAGEENVRAEV